MKSNILFNVLAAGSLCVLAGCKETYEDPEKFIDKYVIQDYVNSIWTPQMLADRKLKGPFVSDVRLQQKATIAGPMTAVCAKLRFEPISPKTIYITDAVFPNRPYAERRVVDAKEVTGILSASIDVIRSKMDNGVYAPVDAISRDRIQGWGLVAALTVLDPSQCEKGLSDLLRDFTTPDKLGMFVHYAVSYVNNGQLEYISDMKNLQQLADALVAVKSTCEMNRQAARSFSRQDLGNIPGLLEILKVKGVKVREAENVKKDAGLAALVTKGRMVHTAIVTANIEREAVGLDSVWPKIGDAVSPEKDDIAGMSFANAGEYFKVALDLANGGCEPWLNNVAKEAVLEGDVALWSVVIDDGSLIEKEDHTPVLISANFDCAKLRATWTGKAADADKVIPIGSCPGIGNSGIVVIYKGGSAQFLTADKVTLRNIYGNTPVDTAGAYLTPNGVVELKK